MTALFNLRATHNPHRYYLPIEPAICGGPPGNRFLFGGVGLACAIKAMELTCKRPVMWATAQYLSFARAPSVVDVDVHVPINGRYTSQAQAQLHVDAEEIITVIGALGERPDSPSLTWPTPPAAPRPEDCPESNRWRDQTGDHIGAHFEVRVAQAPQPVGQANPGGAGNDGRTVLWVRPIGGRHVDSCMLAIIADFVAQGIGGAIGQLAGGNSLDNTIRYAAADETEWVLCDIRINAVQRGIVHGAMYLYSEKGVLLATASQSLILRLHGPRGAAETKAAE